MARCKSRMLHSPDPAIQRIARQQLRQIAAARFKLDVKAYKDRKEELAQLILNSKLGTSATATPKRRNGDIGSLWFDVRGHLHRFGLKLEASPAVEETRTPATRLQLRVPHHAKWLDHRDVLRHVRLHLKNKHWERWAAMKDQGKSARTLGGAGSAFLPRALVERLPLRGWWSAQPARHSQCLEAPASSGARQVSFPRMLPIGDSRTCAQSLCWYHGCHPHSPR